MPADRGPVASVVIPTHNRARLVRSAVRSVLDQTFGPLEIVVVDDGSTDATRESVESLQSDEIRYVRHERRRGAGAARNTGIRLARAEYVGFLDDDDEWFAEKIEKQMGVFERSPRDVALVYTGYHIVSGVSHQIASTWIPEERVLGYTDFLLSTSFMTSIPLIRKSCLHSVGLFDEDLPGCQDYDMWIRLSERYAFRAVPEVLARHFIHGDQITTNLETKIHAKEGVLRKHRERLERHPDILARQLERLGVLHCAAGAFAKGRAHLSESLRLDPSREQVREHLMRSNSDPEQHREFLMRHGFKAVEGIPRFY